MIAMPAHRIAGVNWEIKFAELNALQRMKRKPPSQQGNNIKRLTMGTVVPISGYVFSPN